MKNRPLITGIISVASPIPMFIFTIFWSWIWCFMIGMGLLNYDTIPDWISICSFFPLAISPILCLMGIVHGLIKVKQKLAWLGVLFSVVGLVKNFLLFCVMFYIGSRY